MTVVTQLLDQFASLKLQGFKEAFIRQNEDPAYNSLSFFDRLNHLVSAEVTDRQNRSIKRMASRAKLKYRSAYTQDIDTSPTRNINKSQLMQLTQCDYVSNFQNIIISGATGTGKTYLACALGNHAIAMGYPVYFARVTKLFEEIRLVKGDGSYLKWLKYILKFKVLILDDFGSSPLKPSDLKELLEIIEDRTQAGSLIITSQLDVKDWYNYLSEHTLADAILDRLVHNSHRINLKGDSMRKIKNAIC
ncbi:IS21-like element helper ATPase IstB [bacterium]|nr:IS21-like element helper ATPase IstB [bacterium]